MVFFNLIIDCAGYRTVVTQAVFENLLTRVGDLLGLRCL
ncbi:hypothetical protein VAEU17_3190030 [Vibrio aestuarianus]|nr:hypothetical protein VAEU17_3190030 [Vibrio aestuarianus]